MNTIIHKDNNHIIHQIKWLIAFRIIFAIILLISTFVFCREGGLPSTAQPFLFLYGLSGLLFLFSIACLLLLPALKTGVFSAYFQLVCDSFFITAIIFITGGFASIFTFLYLLVIMGASIMLLQRGSMIIAALCGIEYGVLIDLQYYGVIVPFGSHDPFIFSIPWYYVVYRILIIIIACFAVSFLTGLLAAEAKRAKRDFKIMEEHLKRVERMSVIDELAASMAHEIRNPIASLSGSIQLLQENIEAGSSNDRLIQIVLRETARLSRITSDFLAFARPEAGKKIKFKADQVIEEIVELFRKDPLCTDRIDIKSKLYSEVWLSMDPDDFKQILWNLLKNAAEAIENKGEIRIILSRPKNNQVHLKIIDNGCGIKQKDLKYVFDPFFTTKANGTGLGLSIIHRLVDSYHGMIGLENMQYKGTVCTLILRTSQT